MIQLSDYVTRFLVEHGISDIFLVSGGGIMFLVDSVGRQKGLRYIANHHEQACAIAAEAHSRVTGKPSAILVTTGPGSANALSGLFGAWVDSVPVIVLSGQVRRQVMMDATKWRQLGPQEIDIVSMARPITKYATTILDPERVRFEMEKALHIATSGRPGPVWLDFPLDVQSAMLAEDRLQGFSPASSQPETAPQQIEDHVREVLDLIQSSRRPVLIVGNGIHHARAEGLLRDAVELLKIPAIATYGGIDLLEETHPSCLGRFGPGGTRRANFALQNADLLVAVGASLSLTSIGFNTAGFAPRAKKVMINIDANEMRKPNLTPDVAVESDAATFLGELIRQATQWPYRPPQRWLDACAAWKARYPSLMPEFFDDRDHVNSYVFVDRLSEALAEGAVLVTGISLDAASVYQAFRVKRGQRVIVSINSGAMGWDLPAAVGACVGNGRQPTVLVSGDGCFQFNIQELLTVKSYRLPLKVFLLNNAGYESIRSTQTNYFEGRLVGSDPASGIQNPDFGKLAEAYGLHYGYARNNADIDQAIGEALAADGPALVELNVSPTQPRMPKTMSFRREDGTLETRPLEDMFPFLPREEIDANMHMFDDEE
jgi:acetolactate synthase-1/2/3 large subunit